MCFGHAHTHTDARKHWKTWDHEQSFQLIEILTKANKAVDIELILLGGKRCFKFIVVPGDKLKSCKVLNPIDGVDGKDATRQLDCDPLKRNQLCQKKNNLSCSLCFVYSVFCAFAIAGNLFKFTKYQLALFPINFWLK